MNQVSICWRQQPTVSPARQRREAALRRLRESALHPLLIVLAGCTRCAGRAAFQRELYNQRCIAESEYVDRLKSLAQAARSLEMVMRSTAVHSAAESHRGCMDLEVSTPTSALIWTIPCAIPHWPYSEPHDYGRGRRGQPVLLRPHRH